MGSFPRFLVGRSSWGGGGGTEAVPGDREGEGLAPALLVEAEAAYELLVDGRRKSGEGKLQSSFVPSVEEDWA